jgi:hypothetical protein
LLGWDGHAGFRIELDVPSDVVVLSNYGPWNDVLDQHILAEGARRKFTPSGDDWHRVFDVDLSDRRPWGEGNYYDVQACLPHVMLEWVRGVVPCALLPPGD